MEEMGLVVCCLNLKTLIFGDIGFELKLEQN